MYRPARIRRSRRTADPADPGARRTHARPAPLLAAAVGALLLVAGLAAPALAQTSSPDSDRTWFPRHRLFEPLIADPDQPRYTAALIGTDVLTHNSAPAERPPFPGIQHAHGTDIEGAVGVGFSRAVVRLDSWRGGGMDLGWMVGYFTRFRMQLPSRDQVANDWFVGIPLTLRRGSLSARIRLLHHSSHMGDELEADGVKRIEYSWEGLDGVLAWNATQHTRLYGGGTWTARTNSYLLKYSSALVAYVPTVFTETGALQAGAETGWFPWSRGRAGLVAAVDWQAGDRASWRSQWSVVAGLSGHGDGYGGRLLVRCFSGPSMMGEFFLTEEHYCGLEADAEF